MLTVPVSAEELTLISGMTIKGNIIERSDHKIKIRASGVDVTYYLDEIRSIDGKPVESSAPVEAKVVNAPKRAEPVIKEEIAKTAQPVIEAAVEAQAQRLEEVIEAVETGAPVLSEQINLPADPVPVSLERSPKRKPMTATQYVTVAMITLGVIGFIFVVACYPVFLIAKKTNAAYPYFAFIPILNYYLLCKIAGRPVWWLILYLVPLVGLAVDVIVWMDIAKVRNKPNWMGVLILVPLANLGMMWYLALSDQ
jgi:hypothetical protein